MEVTQDMDINSFPITFTLVKGWVGWLLSILVWEIWKGMLHHNHGCVWFHSHIHESIRNAYNYENSWQYPPSSHMYYIQCIKLHQRN